MYLIPKNSDFKVSYLLYISYKETKSIIIDCVSIISIDDLTDILS